jgi:hypothetical protein
MILGKRLLLHQLHGGSSNLLNESEEECWESDSREVLTCPQSGDDLALFSLPIWDWKVQDSWVRRRCFDRAETN